MTLAEADMAALIRTLPADFAMVEAHETADNRRKGRCVEATRIAVAVMRRLGHDVGPLACDVMAANSAAWRLIGERVPVTRWPPNAWSKGAMCDLTPSAPIRQEPGRRKGFGGHLVVVGDGWFADLTAEQFHAPDLGILCADAIIGAYRPDEATELSLPRGGHVMWSWRPEVRSYRTVPAWRQDVDHELVMLMARRVRLAWQQR